MAANGSPNGRGRRGRGIRVRTTITAVLVVAVSLVVAGIAIVLYVREALRDDVRTTAYLRARAIAEQVSSVDPSFIAGDADEEFVQILRPDGTILTSSLNVAAEPVLVPLSARPGAGPRVAAFGGESLPGHRGLRESR